MTITLPPDVESRLMTEAQRLGVDPSRYATEIIEKALPAPATAPTASPVADQATIDLLNRWEAENATDDPEELARRQQEFDEFVAAMNRNRREMEGPNARTPFPSHPSHP